MSPSSEQGQVTSFVVVFSLTLLVVAGLVLDGGLLLNARQQAADIAGEAARAGAQAVDIGALRASGRHAIDPLQALADADAYLRQVDADGVVTATAEQVTVTVTRTQRLQLLPLVGLREATVTGSGSARSARGVDEVQP